MHISHFFIVIILLPHFILFLRILGPKGPKLLRLSGLDPHLRPQDLTISQWCLLASLAAKHLPLPPELRATIRRKKK
jgi:hypothetical protein